MSTRSVERKTIAVGPAGEWGSSFAKVVAEQGHDVRLFMRDKADVVEFQRTHRTQRLKGVDLPENVKAYSDTEEFVDEVDLLALAIPSRHFRSFYREFKPFLNSQTYVMSLTKGLEEGKHLRMSEILLEEDPTRIDEIAVLSGPNLASEIAQGVFAGTVVAAYNIDTATRIQSWLNSEHFRVYTTDDVAGVELGGSLKNIMALGAGIADTLGATSTSKSLFFTRMLEEMVRFGTALDAHEVTFRGLSGVGDLALSCYGGTTRNYRAGVKRAQGQSVEEILSSPELVEGLYTIKSAVALAKEHNPPIDAPITIGLYKVFFEGLDIHEGINQLMGRQPKKEQLQDKGLRYNLARLGWRALHRVGINPRSHF